MKIVSDCFNVVTTMLSYQYHIKFIKVLDTHVYFIYDSGGAKILVGGGITADKISYMNSFQVQYCNGVAKISILKRHSARMYS